MRNFIRGGWSNHVGWNAMVLAAWLLAAPPTAVAQTTATISGTVTDVTAAVLPGASVTIRNVNTGLVREAFADDRGRYEAPNLPLGQYEVVAELAGFGTLTRSGITLTVGRHAVVDMQLQLGELAEAVTVTGEAALLETRSGTVSNVIDERRVSELPLINRDLTKLTYLQPGVVRAPRGAGLFDGMGETIVVGGARESQNLYMLDGVASGDLSGNPQGAMGAYVGAETVQEFQVITNNYSAEFRSQAGGIISAVTRSGTNQFRGTSFWFHRNDAMDAVNFFDREFGVPKSEFRRNQFGGSLGGPIVRDRTFFFASYEGLRERLERTITARIPTMEARQGILPGRVVPVADAVRPYLALYPVPGQGNTVIDEFGDGTVRIAGPQSRPTDGDFFVVKIDHQLNSGRAGSLSGTFNYDLSDRSTIDPFGGVGLTPWERDESRRHVLSVKHTSIWSPALLNELHFGYNFTQPGGGIPLTDFEAGPLVFNPARPYMGEVAVGELTTMGIRTLAELYEQRAFTIKNATSWTRGSHSLRMGGELNPYRYRQFSCARACNGDWEFRTLEDFLRGIPRRFESVLPGGDTPERNLTQLLFGAYIQDDWSARSDFTLNMGLRYEFATVPKERDGLTAGLRDLNDTETTIGPMFTNATLKSFSPRVGFAWAPGDRKTSLRGGVGVYYEHPMFFHFRTSLQALPPFTLSGRLEPRDVPGGAGIDFPNALQTQLNLLQGRPTLRTMQYDMDTTYGFRWSANVQRQLAAQWVASAGYTGSRFENLWIQSRTDLNQWEGYPEQPQGDKFFPAGAPPIFPHWGDLRMQFPRGTATHHGLTLGLQKRLSRGFDMQLSHTFSRTIDQGSAVTGGAYQQQRSVLSAFDIHLEEARSAYDIRHSFAANFSWELPFGGDLTGLAAVLARGWQVNGILHLSSGNPLSPLDLSDPNAARIGGGGERLRPDVVPGGNPNTIQGGHQQYYDPNQFQPARLGYFGNAERGSVIAPGMATLDMSGFKRIDLGARRNLQFRVELFNALNRVNLGEPNMSVFTRAGALDPEAGRITSTRTMARQLQVGLRFVF